MTNQIASSLGLGALGIVATIATAPAIAFEPERTECIAPANPGGGWDFTCRQFGTVALHLRLIPDTMQVTNLSGGGGGVAFAEVVNSRSSDNELIVAASTATATRLAQNAYPGNTADQVRWLGAVGADYGVIAVAADSEIETLPELLQSITIDPRSVSIGGGSAVGGWDHLKALVVADKAGINDLRSVKYIAFAGGGEAISQLLAGSIQAYSGDLSEAKSFIDTADVRVLAVLAPERLGGEFASIPTAIEQGIDAVGANWRGFYAPGGMSDEAYDYWSTTIAELYESNAWKQVMEVNGLAQLDMTGPEFQVYVSNSISQIEGLSREIGLIN
ncbi:MAG: tripartite tricarboxylate transporter substrate-binding protein [Pseudomonadota bacterium]